MLGCWVVNVGRVVGNGPLVTGVGRGSDDFGRFRTLVYADLPCMQSKMIDCKKIERIQHSRESVLSCQGEGG